MCADQVPSITTNETQIDRLKNQKHDIQSDINEVFGTPVHVTFSLSWLLPIPAMFPDSCRQMVYGYCVDTDSMTISQDTCNDMDSELVPLKTGHDSSESSVSSAPLVDIEGSALTSTLLQAHNTVSPIGAQATLGKLGLCAHTLTKIYY